MPVNIEAITPVLLLQAFETSSLTAGATTNDVFQVSDGRGIVYEVDILSLDVALPPFATQYTGAVFAVLVGGQEIVLDEPFYKYVYAADLGFKENRPLKVFINESQEVRFRATLPLGNYPVASQRAAYFILKYTTKSHTLFTQQFKFKSGQGLKRRSYKLILPQGAIGGTTFNLTESLPKSNGRICAVAIFVAQSDAAAHIINLSINGVNIIENMPSQYFVSNSQRGGFIHPIDITPGSLMRLSAQVGAGAVLAFDENVFVTFYFDN